MTLTIPTRGLALFLRDDTVTPVDAPRVANTGGRYRAVDEASPSFVFVYDVLDISAPSFSSDVQLYRLVQEYSAGPDVALGGVGLTTFATHPDTDKVVSWIDESAIGLLRAIPGWTRARTYLRYGTESMDKNLMVVYEFVDSGALTTSEFERYASDAGRIALVRSAKWIERRLWSLDEVLM